MDPLPSSRPVGYGWARVANGPATRHYAPGGFRLSSAVESDEVAGLLVYDALASKVRLLLARRPPAVHRPLRPSDLFSYFPSDLCSYFLSDVCPYAEGLQEGNSCVSFTYAGCLGLGKVMTF